MTDKHTPGPWEVHGPHDAPWVQAATGENNRSVGIVPITVADARLIAAAPDMLAALRAVLDEHDGYGADATSAVRAAIDKATREQ